MTGCEHGRPSPNICPHCNGTNDIAGVDFSGFIANGEMFVESLDGDKNVIEQVPISHGETVEMRDGSLVSMPMKPVDKPATYDEMVKACAQATVIEARLKRELSKAKSERNDFRVERDKAHHALGRAIEALSQEHEPCNRTHCRICIILRGPT